MNCIQVACETTHCSCGTTQAPSIGGQRSRTEMHDQWFETSRSYYMVERKQRTKIWSDRQSDRRLDCQSTSIRPFGGRQREVFLLQGSQPCYTRQCQGRGVESGSIL
ncbi:hypothetical protein TNCV_3270741 [Trichonephila clavipes]|nr:hypothetical protein TNCV_3270741 [Trichonephila clavipes]